MAKTLVITGADFSTNALDTIVIETPIPCTGISLDKSTLSLSYGASESLTATPTPSNTTDSVSWSSSNPSVATVANGSVSAVGIGTATITAQCGSYSATCTVTVALAWTDVAGVRLSGVTSYSGGGGVGYMDANPINGAMVSSVGTLNIGSVSGDTNIYYPYKIPDGAKRIKITKNATATTLSIFRIQYYSTTTTSTASAETAQLVDDNRSAAFTDNVYIGTIPQHNGYPTIDGIAIAFGLPSGSTFAESDFANITVEFLPEEST